MGLSDDDLRAVQFAAETLRLIADHTTSRLIKVAVRRFDSVAEKLTGSGKRQFLQTPWREFHQREESHSIVWGWAISWDKPRLVIQDDEDMGEWYYDTGAKLGMAGEEYPTHCCDLSPPVPPSAASFGAAN